MERECYIPLSPAERDRSRRIWVQAWHRYRRRRFICWVIGHAAFDLAFGYTSGFPLRDILPFASRSLFPRRAATIDAADIQTITCDVPPPGWWCSRDEGHDGPCAAHPWRDDPRLTDKA